MVLFRRNLISNIRTLTQPKICLQRNLHQKLLAEHWTAGTLDDLKTVRFRTVRGQSFSYYHCLKVKEGTVNYSINSGSVDENNPCSRNLQPEKIRSYVCKEKSCESGGSAGCRTEDKCKVENKCGRKKHKNVVEPDECCRKKNRCCEEENKCGRKKIKNVVEPDECCRTRNRCCEEIPESKEKQSCEEENKCGRKKIKNEDEPDECCRKKSRCKEACDEECPIYKPKCPDECPPHNAKCVPEANVKCEENRKCATKSECQPKKKPKCKKKTRPICESYAEPDCEDPCASNVEPKKTKSYVCKQKSCEGAETASCKAEDKNKVTQCKEPKGGELPKCEKKATCVIEEKLKCEETPKCEQKPKCKPEAKPECGETPECIKDLCEEKNKCVEKKIVCFCKKKVVEPEEYCGRKNKCKEDCECPPPPKPKCPDQCMQQRCGKPYPDPLPFPPGIRKPVDCKPKPDSCKSGCRPKSEKVKCEKPKNKCEKPKEECKDKPK